MDDVTNIILKVVVGVICVLITKYIIPYLKTNADNKRWSKLIDMVQVAVEAAEQSINEKGSVKKEQVTEFVSGWLNSEGIAVTSEELDRLIEAAVFRMNNYSGKVKAQSFT